MSGSNKYRGVVVCPQVYHFEFVRKIGVLTSAQAYSRWMWYKATELLKVANTLKCVGNYQQDQNVLEMISHYALLNLKENLLILREHESDDAECFEHHQSRSFPESWFVPKAWGDKVLDAARKGIVGVYTEAKPGFLGARIKVYGAKSDGTIVSLGTRSAA